MDSSFHLICLPRRIHNTTACFCLKQISLFKS
uniref:Uncharacterized protein n=1 Tax=Arundo donax TaxID=35708 RepID=A0A0A8ZLD7_ARUDO